MLLSPAADAAFFTFMPQRCKAGHALMPIDAQHKDIIWPAHSSVCASLSERLCVFSVSLCDGKSVTTACLFFSVSAVPVPLPHWASL